MLCGYYYLLSEGILRMIGIWEAALSSIESRINRHYFEMWFKPITCVVVEGDRIFLRAPNRYIKEWFEDNYLSTVLAEIRNQTNQEYKVVFEISDDGQSRSSETRLFVQSDPIDAVGRPRGGSGAAAGITTEIHI